MGGEGRGGLPPIGESGSASVVDQVKVEERVRLWAENEAIVSLNLLEGCRAF